MEKKFENNDFEYFVKQNADQYRMFPSEKVWKGINNNLRSRRRWYGIGLAFLLITTAVVTGLMLNPGAKKQQLVATDANIVTAKNNESVNSASSVIIAPAITDQKTNALIISPDNTQKNLFASLPSVELKAKVQKSTSKAAEVPVSINSDESFIADLPNKVENETPVVSKPITSTRNSISTKSNVLTETDNSNTTKNTSQTNPVIVTDQQIIKTNEEEIIAAEENLVNDKESEISILNENDIYPLTIESVINSYKKNSTGKKINWRLNITPAVTYRKLDDNKPFLDAARTTNSIAGTPVVYSFSDINSLVTHRPDIGLQVGISAGYPISKTITLTGGLQFNLSKYNIRASDHSSEIATIALTSSNGSPNSVSAVTNLRNVGGYRASWLHNKYISASIPLGAEIKLSGNNKTIFGFGATIQPTYVLGNRAYLLSTDLKNYAEVPSLTRKWNVNTGFELFAGYTTGKVDWRIGPQARYQLFSSFYNTYPIKEHLFDFGLKVGVTLK